MFSHIFLLNTQNHNSSHINLKEFNLPLMKNAFLGTHPKCIFRAIGNARELYVKLKFLLTYIELLLSVVLFQANFSLTIWKCFSEMFLAYRLLNLNYTLYIILFFLIIKSFGLEITYWICQTIKMFCNNMAQHNQNFEMLVTTPVIDRVLWG